MTKSMLPKWLLSFLLIALFSGCASTPSRFYIPKPKPISSKAVLNPDFEVHKYVNLVNVQNEEDVFMGEYTHEWWANYHRWTAAAIKLLRKELEKRGNIVQAEAATVFALQICSNETGGALEGTLHTDLRRIGCRLDTDQDGIPDAPDQCPGTPDGIQVNSRGCPLDLDDDGVPDYCDQCQGKAKEKAKTPSEGTASNSPKRESSATVEENGRRESEERICGGIFFSIAGNDPPDVTLQLIKTELRENGVVLHEPEVNKFYFSTSPDNWRVTRARLEEALEDRDMLMVKGYPQILELAVTKVNLFWDFHDVGCAMKLRVHTLQDQVRNFTATNISPELYVACDWAMSKSVAGMFVDHAGVKDSDGDGVPDHSDDCPGTPDGVKVDTRGCPLDSDGDGVPDYLDECPETPKGVVVDEKGCPIDTDGDGVPDYRDECPGTPKGVAVDDRGCSIDSDGDGVPDYLDECPNTPGGAKVDEKGCPMDTDGDGVPDYRDECPGTPKGVHVDERGCWVLGEALFDFNQYEIKTRFYPQLDEIVLVLQENPGMVIEIQGHTDNVGSDGYNRKLSENRAKAVKNYLVGKGIDRQRLMAVGFGKSRPKTTNRTEEGRARNRRVEFLPVQ